MEVYIFHTVVTYYSSVSQNIVLGKRYC